MREYFRLHIIRIVRIFREFGINPLIVLLMGALIFVLMSELLFYKTGLAKYLVLLAALSVLFGLGDKQRTDFILTIYGDALYWKIRIVENLIFAIPFMLVLTFKTAFLEAAIVLCCSVLFIFFRQRYSINSSMPTPFSYQPFEYSIGFRRTFLLFPIVYTLTIIAVWVDNMNLGVFSMMLLFLVTLSYSFSPEQEYYVWIHKFFPKRFMKYKAIVAMRNASLLAGPILLELCYFYPSGVSIFVAVFLTGNLYVLTIVLMKYSTYPNDLNLPEGIVLSCSIFFPPVLILILPFYISKANKKLSPLLNDPH